METFEYLQMKLNYFPKDAIEQYNLREVAGHGNRYLYIEVRKGTYSLPHAGILAQELLEGRLNKHRYYQSTKMLGYWRHETKPISFTLIIDDFGVKYVGEEHTMHPSNALDKLYDVETD